MKVYNQEGMEAYADVDQLDTLLKSGWSRTKPNSKKEEVEQKAEVIQDTEGEILMDDEGETSETIEEVKPKTTRKTIQKKK